MILAVIYSFVGMIAFGVATAVGKTLVLRHGAVVSTVRREFFSILTLVLLVLVVGIPETISWSMVALGVLIAGLSYGGPFFQMYALQKNDVGVVIPITSFRIVVMSAVGVLFLGEALTLVKSATLAFVLLGVLVATINLRALRESELLRWGSGVPAALLASVIWGITMPFFMVPTVVLGAIFYALIIEIVIALLALIHMHVRGERIGAFSKSILPEMVVGIGLAIGTTCLNLALATGEITITSAISGASVGVSVFVGAWWYGERLQPRQYIGGVVILCGILLPLLFL